LVPAFRSGPEQTKEFGAITMSTVIGINRGSAAVELDNGWSFGASVPVD
jgi:hypothetical protein